ncbi:MAG: 3'-5' exonuclease [Mucinivorans sp.]
MNCSAENSMVKNYLDGLNAQQRAAAENYEGSALIIAGAGSGKTRTITYRIAHMIRSGVKPWNILALTFTNKAAKEMRARIEEIVPADQLRGLWMGTFHSVFRRILVREADKIGFNENFTIYETADSKNLVKSIVRELELPDDKYKPQQVFARISLAKNSLITPAAYAANETVRSEDNEAQMGEIYHIYALYCQRCKANGAMDFDDILLYMNILIRDYPEVAARYGDMFRYIMVDEYQDTNFSQYLIVKKLAAIHGNVCVVGDDSQSIYSFRGARIENILKFQKDFAACRVYKLEQNYRSTRTIVEAANSLIAHNEQRLEKTLFSEQSQGDKIRVLTCFNDKQEAQSVVTDIANTISDGASPSEIAILYRTHVQSRAFEETLRQRNIPYKIYGGQSFYQRAEIKDMLAYLRLAVNPADDEALKRIINVPARGIGATSFDRICQAALQNGVSIFHVLQTMNPEQIGIRGAAKAGIARFLEAFAELSTLRETLDAYEFATAAAKNSGLVAFYSTSKAIEDKTKLDNIEELLNSIKSFVTQPAMGPEAVADDEPPREAGTMTIAEWLNEVSLLTDMDQQNDDGAEYVTMLTVHSSKGLEFNYTYLVGLEEDLFPSIRGVEDQSQIEEERRLFYVALTRARLRATISYAMERFKWGDVKQTSPSRFIEQIDKQYLDISPLYVGSLTADDDDDSPFSRRVVRPAFRSVAGVSAQPARQVYQKPTNNFKQFASSEGVPIESSGELSVGTTVSHQRFGNGKITSIEKTPTDTMVEVDFAAAGHKTLLLKYAKLRVVKI